MKKVLLFLSVMMFSTMAWAGYGILVNGCEYYEGTLNPSPGDPSFTEYMAHVSVQKGCYCQLYDADNQAAWVVELDKASQSGFTKASDRYDCTVDGCFDFYIKLKYGQDQLYIGEGSNCGEPQNLCPTTGFYVAGNGKAGNPWCCGLSWDEKGCPMDSTNSIAFNEVPAGQYAFKVTNGTWKQSWGGSSVDASLSRKGWVTDTTGNVAFTIKETADITISFDGKKIVLTSTQPFAPTWTGSSVPRQCTDVLMQGFYYDSHEVNDTSLNGTNIFGDTKWRTLMKQTGEIGAYFDMIWLPPSGLASGTGYHPRQYSNQNSDWGSRNELNELIRQFHQSNTKVIADIVINHIEAMEGWCKLSVQNFGKYGTYEPDTSWICRTDELNKSWSKHDTLAGDCWGKATGDDDDGENWDGARDWSHNMPKVQEMFKAYLQWMNTEVGYDGWRYDKGDGFHNWHMWNYNQASKPAIAFMECWRGQSDITDRIEWGKYDVAAIDFQTKYSVMDKIAGWNYVGRGDGLCGQDAWKKYAITFVDNHDMFRRSDAHGQEFGGYLNSMTTELKYRMLDAYAWLLSMPGIPCVFYPHWFQYKEFIKPMIDARHKVGVHSESEVKDQYWDWSEEEKRNKGYQATIVGKNGYIILCLGTKTGQTFQGFEKAVSGYNNFNNGGQMVNESYEMWILTNNPTAPKLIVTPDTIFEDSIQGVKVGVTPAFVEEGVTIYYTTDGTDPTTSSSVYADSLVFTQTTIFKVMSVNGTAQSEVQTYTYTYREPLKRGIRVRFDKPEEWEKVYYYAWIPEIDSLGKTVGSTNVMGAYPGRRIYRDVDGWYSYEFPLSMEEVNFCISSGDDCGGLNVRSNDLKTTYDVYYNWEEGFAKESQHELVVEEPYEIPMEFEVQISPEGGEFRDSINGELVQLTVLGKKGAYIYYTTDGSDPSKCAVPAIDTVSFYVKKTSIIQAYAYDLKSEAYTDTNKIELTYKDPQAGPLVVKFIKPHNWQNLGLYAFTRIKRAGQKDIDTEQSLDGKSGAWPGMLWTTFEKSGEDSIYYFQMKDEWKEIYVIFNNYTTVDSKKIQTQDIYLAENTCFVWNVDCKRAVVSPTCSSEPSAVDEIFVTDHENGKFIQEGQLYIKVGEVVYDALGRRK